MRKQSASRGWDIVNSRFSRTWTPCPPPGSDPEALIASGHLRAHPLTYEDFLPVSAAGIFQSNLGDEAAQDFAANPNRAAFEADLGAPVQDEFALYQQLQDASLARCMAQLGMAPA
ncbi:2-oxoadipate dioxygenase/decarboxylase family protein [Paracoccus indicus]|uniref:2-oxoadipate dioxygenase/decarboxylase family protein n=1 Tax=Paracoccus indicus TaxID=2079229 RepID=UPI0030014A1A